MQLKFLNNSTMFRHFLIYQDSIIKINKLISTSLTDSQISELYNKKYSLNEFYIYKYITAYDYIVSSLG